jgi:hypothetical protein
MDVLITAQSEDGKRYAVVRNGDGTLTIVRVGTGSPLCQFRAAELDACLDEFFRVAGIEPEASWPPLRADPM